jgi:hypothetical protein
VVFTAEGVREIVRHLGRLDGGLDDPANQQMLVRVDEILAGVREPCAEDANWYNHELYESSLIDQNPAWRADPNAAWRAAHDQTLADQNMQAEDVYPRDVVQANQDHFSIRIRQYWGLLPSEEDPR